MVPMKRMIHQMQGLMPEMTILLFSVFEESLHGCEEFGYPQWVRVRSFTAANQSSTLTWPSQTAYLPFLVVFVTNFSLPHLRNRINPLPVGYRHETDQQPRLSRRGCLGYQYRQGYIGFCMPFCSLDKFD